MSSTVKVFVGESGTKPTRGSSDAAGWDLYATDDIEILQMNDGVTRICVNTKVRFALPVGTYGRISPRSGLAYRNGIQVLAGVVDRDYRGEIKVILYNPEGFRTDDECPAPKNIRDNLQIKAGDRIAQFIVTKIAEVDELTVVDDADQLGDTHRGGGGFGSTGK